MTTLEAAQRAHYRAAVAYACSCAVGDDNPKLRRAYLEAEEYLSEAENPEIFFIEAGDQDWVDEFGEETPEGWYRRIQKKGPRGEPNGELVGPFKTKKEAEH